MKHKEPHLIIDLDDDYTIFSVVIFDENKNHTILKNKSISSKGIHKGAITNVKLISENLKKIINELENEIDYFFSKVVLIINPKNVDCLNISGYKKLNGSQVLREDVSYILNDVKNIVQLTEDKHTAIHLFNSSFSLDSDNLENLPVGLFGDFYNQNMSFVLVQKNLIKNFKLALTETGLYVDRIILKPFAECVNLISKHLYKNNFLFLELSNDVSNINIIKNKSLIFSQSFDFGLGLALQDVSKLCSLKIEEVNVLLADCNLGEKTLDGKENYIDKKYFTISPYRKVKLQLVLNVITARLEEFIEIFAQKNSNLTFLKKEIDTFLVKISEKDFSKNIKYLFMNINKKFNFKFIDDLDDHFLIGINGAAELISKGWEKEAIPIIQQKKSFISGFFSRLFK